MVVPVINMQGIEVGKLTIDEHQLGGEVNAALVKQAYVKYHAGTRQGSARSLNRHNVEGSTRKIVKQKGTGGARHGDRKVPHFRGGGHAHSKKKTREDFRLDMPKKMRRKANLNALLAKLVDNEVKIIDSLKMSEPRTKDFVSFLENIKVNRSALVALPLNEDNVRRSARNIEGVKLVPSNQINCFELLNHRYLVIGKADLEGYLKGPQSQIDKSAKLAPLGKAPAKPVVDKPKPARRRAQKRAAQAAAEAAGTAPARAPRVPRTPRAPKLLKPDTK